MTAIQNPEVASKFASYPPKARKSMLALRALVLAAVCCASNAAGSKNGYSLLAGSDERCDALASIASGEERNGYATLSSLGRFLPLKDELSESLEATRVRDFDFDNDGVPDQVYFREEFTRYQDATIWYVYRGPLRDVGDLPREVATLTVYPCQFDSTVSESRACAPISQDADDATVNVSVEGITPSVSFRVRYTNVFPVFENRKTLLLLKSTSRDTRDYAAVIEPTGSRTFRALCIFKRGASKRGPDESAK
jgi:hypothetical protein